MKKFPPLPIVDMLHLRSQSPIAPLVGRKSLLSRIARTIARKPWNNMLLVGRRGVGKSSIIQGLAQSIAQKEFASLPALPYLQLQTMAAAAQLKNAPQEALVDYLSHAFASLPSCVFIIDDAERLLHLLPDGAAFDQVFAPFTGTISRRLILVLEEERLPEFKEKFSGCLKTFDHITASELKDSLNQRIIAQRSSSASQTHHVSVKESALETIYQGSKKIASDRSQPDRALRFLDEVCSAASLEPAKKVTAETVETIIAQRSGLPSRSLGNKRRQEMQNLPEHLAEAVIGQPGATTMVANVIRRGLLGLKNQARPLGSFLFLGPSGVGKTELARVLAKEVFGSDKAFVRIDMSEYSDSHTAARLIGAPPGYVGYEAGGQLTTPVKQQPFSLVLLDEIEKAHPSIFDIFLQVLEDGRLTDGQGQTIDFSQTIIIATSNIGITDIVSHAKQGQDVTAPEFLRTTMMPLLTSRFRTEFLNRFEGMAVFQPFSTASLLAIARLEIKKLEKRLAHHHVKVAVSDEELLSVIQNLSDPHLGARPLKRFIEQRCEEAIAQNILQSQTHA
ncbi:MAG: ATP-dependent Clp protease ATP-binding subunit [Candidatus Portnoybacteria bacterium]|nr:ATP-dependent Clp protease ATP-binding subunit [Candidatus Portnoybacteria bacterium]